jgi:non-ribosomal peptide synthase protein (TIGR01720 family)
VLFNYLGHFGQVTDGPHHFRMTQASPGAVRHPGNARAYVFEVDAGILDGSLQVRWTYSQQLHRPETVQALAHSFERTLLAIIAACLSAAKPGYTAADFPLARLNETEWSKVAKALSKIDAQGS